MADTLEAHAPHRPYWHAGRRYLRAPVPVVFPIEEKMPETGRHMQLRTLLYLLLKHNYGKEACIGSEQFVYWDTQAPSRCCAPDIFLRLGQPDAAFDVWKVWERGAPDVAVEIISPSDASDAEWSVKLERYHAMGVRELVRFDPSSEANVLRIWDNLGGDLVERDVRAEGGAACGPLGLAWIVCEDGEIGRALRLAKDGELLLTGEEQARRESQEERRAKEEERRAKEEERRAKEEERRAREAAERRAAAAEAEVAALRKRLAEGR